tara:strand:- start:248 stop:514 length:267 start_codon:yes stop_codon:yes gene_type:complete
VIHIKDFLDTKSSNQAHENVTFECCTDSDLIPFENNEVEPSISRVQIASLVDKLMAMPEEKTVPDFDESYMFSEDPFEHVAESILPDF